MGVTYTYLRSRCTMVFSMNEHDFSQLPPAAQAYIRELEARAATNAQHIVELNERIKLLEVWPRLRTGSCR